MTKYNATPLTTDAMLGQVIDMLIDAKEKTSGVWLRNIVIDVDTALGFQVTEYKIEINLVKHK